MTKQTLANEHLEAVKILDAALELWESVQDIEVADCVRDEANLKVQEAEFDLEAVEDRLLGNMAFFS